MVLDRTHSSKYNHSPAMNTFLCYNPIIHFFSVNDCIMNIMSVTIVGKLNEAILDAKFCDPKETWAYL